MKLLTCLSLLLLTVAAVQGIMASFAKGHCLCIGPGLSGVNPKHIGKLEIYRPGINCDHIEVIVTLKHSGKKRCLSNKSKQRLIIIEESDSSLTEELSLLSVAARPKAIYETKLTS